MHSGWLIQFGVRRVSIKFILIALVAFVLVTIVYHEFAQPRLRDLNRKFREWMYFEGREPLTETRAVTIIPVDRSVQAEL